jgi:plasmid stabilization system protein ParE
MREIAKMHKELVGPVSAEKITNKILDAIDLLAYNPYMGSVPKHKELEDEGFRVLVCGNYLCFYKVEFDVIEIYHIADGRRDYPKLII